MLINIIIFSITVLLIFYKINWKLRKYNLLQAMADMKDKIADIKLLNPEVEKR